MLEEIIKTDAIMPTWITASLTALIGKRQKALHSGNVQEFK